MKHLTNQEIVNECKSHCIENCDRELNSYSGTIETDDYYLSYTMEYNVEQTYGTEYMGFREELEEVTDLSIYNYVISYNDEVTYEMNDLINKK